MEKLFFITNLDAWKHFPKFHENFFVANNACLYGLLVALGTALLLSLCFYFGCANNKRENSLATIPVWTGFLVATAIVVFLIANFCIIGKSNTRDAGSMFYKYSFYKANTEYVIREKRNNPNEQLVTKLDNDKQIIDRELNEGKGVRYPFSIGCAMYAMLFFYVISVLVKSSSYQGQTIPHLWPIKNK